MTTRRAFLAVTALRWFPVGLQVPLFVRYPAHAGVSLADVGVLFAMLTSFAVLFELPTGGLADSWGRRRTLILAAATGFAALAVMVVADSLVMFMLAFALTGVYWALDSGPLSAWYVDAALDLQPGRDMSGDLARANTVVYSAVATGSLASAGLGIVALPIDGLTATVAVALGLQVAYMLAVVLLVRETPGRRTHAQVQRASILLTIRTTVRAGWHRPLRLLLAVEILWGAGLSVVELLWQPLTAQKAGSHNDWVFGLMGAAGWAASAGGAALFPSLLRLLGGRVVRTAALLRVVQGLALIPLALAADLRWIVVGYVAAYVLQGPSNTAHSTLLHLYAERERRATLLSLDTFVQRVSGGLASVGAGVLATRAGAPTVFAIAAVALAAAAGLYLASGEPSTQPTAAAEAVGSGRGGG